MQGTADEDNLGLAFFTSPSSGFADVVEEAMRINYNGNVGIGTPTPTHLLTLETASSPGLKIKDTTQGATLLAFSQDSNSHIGTYSSHPLVFDTNSTERMRIDQNGNVGIGTTSPGEKLEVVGNIRTNVGNGLGFMLTGSSASGLVRNAGTGLALRTNSIDKLIIDSTGSVAFSAYTGTNEQGTPTYLLGTDASGNVVKTNTVPGSGAGPYLPLTGGTLSGPGNLTVGGTTNLSSTLTVVGVTTLANVGYLGDGLGSVQYTLQSANNGFGTIDFGDVADANIGRLSYSHVDNSFLIRTNNATALTLDSSQNAIFVGKVGIGTTTAPTYDLDIHNNNGRFRFLATTGYAAIELQNDANGFYIARNGTVVNSFATGNTAYAGIMSVQGNYNLELATNGVVRQTIDGSGNVGIGTASPDARLDVNGGLNSTHAIFSGQDGRGLKLSTENTLNNDDGVVYDAQTSTGKHLFKVSGAEKMRIDSSGNVMIGNTNASAKLDIRQDTGYALRTENASGSTFRVEADTGNIEAAGSVKMGDDTDTAVVGKVGTMRYRTATNEPVPITGTDIAIDGDFSAPSSWILQNAGSTISGGKLNQASVPNGQNVYQTPPLTVGSIYSATFTISNYVAGSVRVLMGSTGTTAAKSSNGTFTVTATAAGNTVLYIQAIGTTTLSVDNISVLEVTEEDASYADMCMQTGASTYEWVNIVRNTY